MPQAKYENDDTFPLQFAWQLPDGDYLRAVFEAHVRDHVPQADKYVVTLARLIAGRQEDKDGKLRSSELFSAEYWGLVQRLIGRTITIAYETDDGRAVQMRLATLTGEHNFFTRYDDVSKTVQDKKGAKIAGDD